MPALTSQPVAPQPQSATQIPVTTPEQMHQDAAQAVASNIGQILGSDVAASEVIPVTAESKPRSPEREQLHEMTNRIFLDKPGYEPSKSFLKKLWERMKKKNPDSIVTLKEE